MAVASQPACSFIWRCLVTQPRPALVRLLSKIFSLFPKKLLGRSCSQPSFELLAILLLTIPLEMPPRKDGLPHYRFKTCHQSPSRRCNMYPTDEAALGKSSSSEKSVTPRACTPSLPTPSPRMTPSGGALPLARQRRRGPVLARHRSC